MVLECWVIIIILGIVAYMFIRSRRKSWAPVVMPLMLLPFVNIIYSPIGRHIWRAHPGNAYGIRIALFAVTVAAASCWVVYMAHRLPSGRSKYAYVVCSVAFTALLAILFIVKQKY